MPLKKFLVDTHLGPSDWERHATPPCRRGPILSMRGAIDHTPFVPRTVIREVGARHTGRARVANGAPGTREGPAPSAAVPGRPGEGTAQPRAVDWDRAR